MDLRNSIAKIRLLHQEIKASVIDMCVRALTCIVCFLGCRNFKITPFSP